MRTYANLSPDQQEQARERALNTLLGAAIEGAVRFNDELNSDDLQARINQAIAEADEMQTPWFAGEYVMDAAGEDLKSMAICDAESALYPEPGESIIHL